MTPRWTDSSSKHGVPRSEIAYAIATATYEDVLDGQAVPDDELEVLVT